MAQIDEFADAFIGWVELGPDGEHRAVYNHDRCVQIIVNRDGISIPDAEERLFHDYVWNPPADAPLFLHTTTLGSFREMHDLYLSAIERSHNGNGAPGTAQQHG